MNTVYQNVALESIRESASNPRQHFDEKGMAELTESIRTKGVVAPLLLRPMDGFYELVDGARRYRAAKAAGLEDVPAILRHMSDEDALEIQVIANLQRQDVHPLDEAEGYKRLLDTKRYDVAALAAKVGKSMSYIYQRLALNSLIPEVKKALWSDEISTVHGSTLARLQAADQKKIFANMTRWGDGVWPIARLRKHIEEEVMCILDAAGFDKKDPLLVSKAGACTVCPKRSGFNKELFNDITTKDRCTDPVCFRTKVEAHLLRAESQAKANKVKLVRLSDDPYSHIKGVISKASEYSSSSEGWRTAKKGCASPIAGIIADGDSIGKVMQVCTNVACKTCNPRGQSMGTTGRSSGSGAVTPAARYKRRMEIWENKVEDAARQICYQQLVGQIPGEIGRTQLLMLLRELRERNHGGEDVAARLVGVKLPKKDYMHRATLASWEKAMRGVGDTNMVQLLFAMLLQREMISDVSSARPSDECFLSLSDQYGKENGVLSTARAKGREQLEKSKPKPPKKEKKPAAAKNPKKATAIVDVKCEVCGCTDDHGCDDECWWDQPYLKVGRYVCSNCTGAAVPIKKPAAKKTTKEVKDDE